MPRFNFNEGQARALKKALVLYFRQQTAAGDAPQDVLFRIFVATGLEAQIGLAPHITQIRNLASTRLATADAALVTEKTALNAEIADLDALVF